MNNSNETLIDHLDETLIDHLEFCEDLKRDYYTRCINTLYVWPHANEETIKQYVIAMGLTDYVPAITWLLINKSALNAAIMYALCNLAKCSGLADYHAILDRLKVALVVCNKRQATKILIQVALNADDPKHAIRYLNTF